VMDIRDLYQEVILDHSRRPRNFGRLADANCEAEGDNPLCGDRVHIYLRIEGDRVTEARFEGRGCAISMASASLMTDMLRGLALDEVRALFQHFHAVVTHGESAEACDWIDLDKLNVLSGVREYPVRIKCATLAWHTMKAALEGKRTPVRTE